MPIPPVSMDTNWTNSYLLPVGRKLQSCQVWYELVGKWDWGEQNCVSFLTYQHINTVLTVHILSIRCINSIVVGVVDGIHDPATDPWDRSMGPGTTDPWVPLIVVGALLQSMIG